MTSTRDVGWWIQSPSMRSACWAGFGVANDLHKLAIRVRFSSSGQSDLDPRAGSKDLGHNLITSSQGSQQKLVDERIHPRDHLFKGWWFIVMMMMMMLLLSSPWFSPKHVGLGACLQTSTPRVPWWRVSSTATSITSESLGAGETLAETILTDLMMRSKEYHLEMHLVLSWWSVAISKIGSTSRLCNSRGFVVWIIQKDALKQFIH